MRNLRGIQSHTTVELTEYEDDDDDDDYGNDAGNEGEDEDDEDESKTYKLEEMRYADARMGICSVCRYSIASHQDASPADFDNALLCSDGHLLCHRCITKFNIQSGTHTQTIPFHEFCTSI